MLEVSGVSGVLRVILGSGVFGAVGVGVLGQMTGYGVRTDVEVEYMYRYGTVGGAESCHVHAVFQLPHSVHVGYGL